MDAVEIIRKMDLGALSQQLGRFASENQSDRDQCLRYAAMLAMELKGKIDELKNCGGRDLPKSLQSGITAMRLAELEAERAQHRQAIGRLDSEEMQLKRSAAN